MLSPSRPENAAVDNRHHLECCKPLELGRAAYLRTKPQSGASSVPESKANATLMYKLCEVRAWAPQSAGPPTAHFAPPTKYN